MPKNFDVRHSPFSQAVSSVDQKKFVDMLDEITPIIQKYGFDYFLLSIHNPNASKGGLLTTALGTKDTSQATDLLSDAFRTVQEYIQSETPTVPRGIA